MINILINPEKSLKIQIKSQILQQLEKRDRVAIICPEQDAHFYEKHRWRSKIIPFECAKDMRIDNSIPLTIFTYPTNQDNENLKEKAYEIIIHILKQTFDYLFIDGIDVVLEKTIQKGEIQRFINVLNDCFPLTHIVIATSLNRSSKKLKILKIINKIRLIF